MWSGGKIRGFRVAARAAIVALGLMGFVGVAAAQEPDSEGSPAPEQAAPETGPTDIVKLKNGGMIRGKISELIPGDAVVIVTLTGDTRRFPMSEVEYAGPEKPASAPAAPKKTAPKEPAAPESAEPEAEDPATVTVRLESVDDPIEFFGNLETESKEQINSLCKAPCDIPIAPGNYKFALGKPGTKEPLEATPIVRITSPATVRGKFRSRAGLRTAGGLTLFFGTIAGLVIWGTASGEEEACYTDTNGLRYCTNVDVVDELQLWTGRFITGASIITGLILVTRGDSATVQLVAGAPSGLRDPSRFSVARDRGTAAPPTWSGLSVVGRF